MLQVKIVLSFYQIVTQIQPVYGIVMPANVRDTREIRPRYARDAHEMHARCAQIVASSHRPPAGEHILGVDADPLA